MYSNSITAGNWKGYVAEDLVAYMDSHYRTLATRTSRGLAGHSMGGYGTLRIAMKRPDVFSAIYALSSCCLNEGTVRPARDGAPSAAESVKTVEEARGNRAAQGVAAAINWFGITDVGDVIEGPNAANLAVTWLGSLPDRMEIAKRVSPLTHVRVGLPPILTIHGDKDQLVPYQHAVRLHEALTKAGVANQLLTIREGRHGGFTPEQRTKIFATIREFLTRHGLPATN